MVIEVISQRWQTFLQQEKLIQTHNWLIHQASSQQPFVKEHLAELFSLYFFYLLEPPQQIFLQNYPFFRRKIQKQLQSLEDYLSLTRIKSVLQNTDFNFIPSEQKDDLAVALVDYSPLYEEVFNQPDSLRPTNPELWLLTVGARYNNDPPQIKNKILWAFSQTLSSIHIPCLHSKHALQVVLNFFCFPYQQLMYEKWVEIGQKKLEQCREFEISFDFFCTIPGLEQKFLSSTYAQTPLKDTVEIVSYNLRYMKEDQVSNEQLIDFLYKPRISASKINDADKQSLFDLLENKKNLQHPQHEDWFAFWAGVQLFEKRRSNHSWHQYIEKEKLRFTKPQLVEAWFRSVYQDRQQEMVWCLFIDHKQHLIDYEEISRGTVNQTTAHPREIFAMAIAHRASGIILIHNHPSGSPAPSVNDKLTTKKIEQAGEIIGIELLDHLIIGKQSYYSFSENKILPSM